MIRLMNIHSQEATEQIGMDSYNNDDSITIVGGYASDDTAKAGSQKKQGKGNAKQKKKITKNMLFGHKVLSSKKPFSAKQEFM